MLDFRYDEEAVNEIVSIFKGLPEDNSGDWAYEHIANWLKIQRHLPVELNKDEVKEYFRLAYWIEPEDIKQEIFLFSVEKGIPLHDVRFRDGFKSMLMVVIRDWITWKEHVFHRIYNDKYISTEEEVVETEEQIVPFLHPQSIFQTLPLSGIEPYLLYLRYIGYSNQHIADNVLTCDLKWLTYTHIKPLENLLSKFERKHQLILRRSNVKSKDPTGFSQRVRLRRGSERRSN